MKSESYLFFVPDVQTQIDEVKETLGEKLPGYDSVSVKATDFSKAVPPDNPLAEYVTGRGKLYNVTVTKEDPKEEVEHRAGVKPEIIKETAVPFSKDIAP